MNTNLENLAQAALAADIKAKEAKDYADEAKAIFVEALIAEGKFNANTKAVGDVRTKVTPNRFFDAEAAFESLDKKTQKAVLVTKPDPKLIQANITPVQKEQFMKDYAVPFKLGLDVLGD